ncbi:MAG: hypothetical protein L0Y70_23115 [Gemmataceae bacterium]|nr:hypothetical protein [Gemmataceae bacterium]
MLFVRRGAVANQRMKLTGAAILVPRGITVLQAAPAAYPYRSPQNTTEDDAYERHPRWPQ